MGNMKLLIIFFMVLILSIGTYFFITNTKGKDKITVMKNNQINNQKTTTKNNQENNKQNINAGLETVQKECSPGKIRYEGKCLLEMTPESCKKKDPFFKPDDSKTKCVRKSDQ